VFYFLFFDKLSRMWFYMRHFVFMRFSLYCQIYFLKLIELLK